MASAFQLRLAERILLSGGIIAYPTDTLFGLSCDPANRCALARLNQIKQRPQQQPCILLASQPALFSGFIRADFYLTPATFFSRLCATNEPTSWIVPAHPDAPRWLTASDNSIAIRLSRDPLTAQLCALLKRPLVSTSANIHGQQPVRSLLALRKKFGKRIDLLLQSHHASSGQASTIKLWHNKRAIRL